MINLTEKTPYNDLDFDQLQHVCLSCEKCALAANRTNVVFGSGPKQSPLLIIGEGPGANEDVEGKPFVGRSGKLLTKILSSVGINRETDAYITNIVKCRPPQNRAPLADEVAQCKPYLIRQIQLIQPKIMILLGSPALKTILEESLPISKIRGQWYKAQVGYMDEPLYIMTLFHPSYLLRNDRSTKGSPKWLTWQDINEVKAALDFHQKSQNAEKN